MSYNYPTWFGQGSAPQFYKPAASYSPTFGASSGGFATSPQNLRNQAALPTWFGTGPAPEFYRPAEPYKPFEHGAGVHAGFHSGLQSLGFQGHPAGLGQHTPTVAPVQLGSAFPTWFGSGPPPEFYKAPGQFDLGYGQFGGQMSSGQGVGGPAFGGHSLSHVVGHSGLGGAAGGTSAYPTWFGAGAVPDFYKAPGQFDHSFGQFGPQGHHGHGFHGGVPPGVNAQHAQLMQEVRHFEPHNHPGQHPGLRGSGTAIDQASGPKDLPNDASHKQLMAEVRKHDK